jgi:hypothetical protein
MYFRAYFPEELWVDGQPFRDGLRDFILKELGEYKMTHNAGFECYCVKCGKKRINGAAHWVNDGGETYCPDCYKHPKPADEMHELRQVVLEQGKQIQALWRIVKSQKSEIETLWQIARLLHKNDKEFTGMIKDIFDLDTEIEGVRKDLPPQLKYLIDN